MRMTLMIKPNQSRNMKPQPSCLPVTRILFVCHGNICRSPMAQYVMEYLVKQAGLSASFEIDSAATTTEEIGNPPHPGTRRALAAHGIPCGKHRAQQITAEDARCFDSIVIMDGENLRHLRRLLPADCLPKVSKLLSWAGSDRDVADPWYTGDFEATFDDVWTGCNALLKTLTA